MPRLLLFFVVLATLMRGYFAMRLGLAEDEAYYWTWSQNLDVGYFDHPPLIAWWIALGNIFGNGEFWVRLLNIICYPLVVWLTWELSNRRTIAGWILISYPLFIASFLATPDMPLLVFWTLTLWALQKQRFVWLAIGIGGACLSKLTGLLLFPIVIFAKPSLLTNRYLWVSLGTAILCQLPFIWWLSQHQWVSLLFQFEHIQQSKSHLLFFASQWGLMGIFLFPLLFWGLKSPNRVATLSTFPLLLMGILFGGEANWIAPAYIGATMLLSDLKGRAQRIIWMGIATNGMILVLFTIHIIVPLHNLPKDPLYRLEGGQTLGDSIAAWNEKEVWCSRYQEASLIWYYSQIRTNTLPLPGRKSQFDMWRSSFPEEGIYIRPFRTSEYREVEEFNRTTTSQFNIQHFSTQGSLIHQWQVFPFSQQKKKK